MSETMQHNSEEESQAPLFQIDGQLSAEEKAIFAEALKNEGLDITHETCSDLADFMNSDVIPNIETSNFTSDQIAKIQSLSVKLEAKNKANNMQELTTMKDFGISPEVAKSVTESLSPYDMQVGEKLDSYKGYIDSELSLPINSSLSEHDHTNIMNSLNGHISKVVENIPTTVGEAREKHTSLSDREVVGIINDAIEADFGYIKETLLPNTKLFLASTTEGFSQASEDIYYMRGLEGDIQDHNIHRLANKENTELQSKLTKLGTQLISGQDIKNIPDINKSAGGIIDEFPTSFGLTDGIAGLSNSSFLSPEDGEKYKTAKIRAVCFMIIQTLPTGATDLVSMGIDGADILSNNDQSFEALKGIGAITGEEIIDEKIHVGKEYWERALSFVSLATNFAGGDIIIKGSKAVRIMQSAGITATDLLGEIPKLSKTLGLSPETTQSFRKTIGAFGKNRGNSKFMERAESNGNLSDVPGTHKFILRGKEIPTSAREKAFLERLELAYKTGEVPFSVQEISPENIKHLNNALNAMHNTHGTTKIGNHRFSQIADKLKVAKELGIPSYVSKIAIREGFAGQAARKIDPTDIGSTVKTSAKVGGESADIVGLPVKILSGEKYLKENCGSVLNALGNLKGGDPLASIDNIIDHEITALTSTGSLELVLTKVDKGILEKIMEEKGIPKIDPWFPDGLKEGSTWELSEGALNSVANVLGQIKNGSKVDSKLSPGEMASQVSAAIKQQPIRDISGVHVDISKNSPDLLKGFIDDLDKLSGLLPDGSDSDIALSIGNIVEHFGDKIPAEFLDDGVLKITSSNINEFRDAMKKVDADFSQKVKDAQKNNLISEKIQTSLSKNQDNLGKALLGGNPKDLKHACSDFAKQLSKFEDTPLEAVIALLPKEMFKALSEAYKTVNPNGYKEVMLAMRRSRDSGTHIVKGEHQEQFLKVLRDLSV